MLANGDTISLFGVFMRVEAAKRIMNSNALLAPWQMCVFIALNVEGKNLNSYVLGNYTHIHSLLTSLH